MHTRRFISAVITVLFVFEVLDGQTIPNSSTQPSSPAVSTETPGQDDQESTTLRSVRREVLVDMVVRDKHHRLVTNLRPDEVEIYEDGVLQKVNAFRNVAGSEQLRIERETAAGHAVAPATASPEVNRADAPGATTPVTSLHDLNFVAVVFADIAPLNVRFAREAVMDFLNSGNLPNTYVSIYRLNRSLKVVQFYTSNKDILVKAVNSSTNGVRSDDTLGVHAEATSAAIATLQAAADNLLSSPRLDQATAQAVQNAILNPIPIISKDPLFARDSASQDASVSLGNAILTQARIESGLRFASSLSNGMDALDSLREIVRSQEQLPGRKVVLYLSDGLEFPMSRRDAIDGLMSYANRSGVSFYGVDTRGLSVEDPMMRSLAELERTGAISSAQVSDPRTGHKEDDNIQLTAVANKQLALRELAESTGGFVVTDTNEIAAPMKRVMEDIRSHYEVAYTPTATNYDGHFRKIEVKIKRSHLEVHTRKGYFALPNLNGVPLQPYEAEALAAMDSNTVKERIPYQVAVMKFRPGHTGVEHQIAFEVPLSSFRPTHNPRTGVSQIRAALVALIRNGAGEVVGKVSRELVRDLPSQVTSSASDRILYMEPVELPSGHYVIDTAVTDEDAGRTAVKRLAFFVDSSKDFGLSSLELVRPEHASSAVTSAADGTPAIVDPGRMLPVLSDTVESSKGANLYFVLYPAKLQSGEEPRVVLQVLQDGREIARKPLSLPRPEADGSVPMMLKLSPTRGQCDILVTAQQGALLAQSRLSVKVE
jgi:VWFA-related protein